MENLCSQMENLLSSKSKPNDATANQELDILDVKCVLISDEDSLNKMTDEILSQTKNGTPINVDFEGIDLSRHGKICLGQFHVSGSRIVYVVDFVEMNPFKAADGKLVKILESTSIQKIFFDPRNDSDALANLHNVQMNNVLCLQVSEVAYRKFKRGLKTTFVMGLQKTMSEYLMIGHAKKQAMLQIKQKGIEIFAPEFGGSYEMFEKRPLSKDLLAYSAVDVYFLDDLKKILFDSLSTHVQQRVKTISEQRLVEHQRPNYSPKGKHMAFSPL